jgi:pimeloyl-ACP methyl ester carboxylesterase
MTMSQPTPSSSLTVVLVHGAFADSSSWAGVIERLHAKGTNVIAAANPLRGLKSDSAYIAAVLGEISGPVLAVGHSYGGAVISNAATGRSNVVGLVYVAAFAPDEGEVLLEVSGTSKDSLLGPALVTHQYAIDGEPWVEFTLDPAQARTAFAADLSDKQADVIGTVQRPTGAAAFTDPSGAPAWKTLPSWAVVATADRAAGTDLVRAHAERAGADITEVDGSHLIMLSKPDVVTEVIEAALAKLS